MKKQHTKLHSFVFFEILLLLVVIVIAAFSLRWGMIRFYKAAYPIKYAQSVEVYSAQNQLPPSLVYAVIRTESGFDPTAHSRIGARGLMQITKETFDWIAYREKNGDTDYDLLLLEDANIRYGTALLRLHLEEFGSVENALCAYHAGRGSLQKWLADPLLSPGGKTVEQIPFGDTRRYVKKVLETQKIYQKLYSLT